MEIAHRRARLLGTTILAATALAMAPMEAAAQKGKGGQSGGGGDKDLSVCITMSSAGDLTSDGSGDYCGSVQGVNAAVGRRRAIGLGLGDKPNQDRRLVLTLGTQLPEAPGDPDPNTDGGQIQQPTPGDWSTHPLPEIPPEGLTGTLQAAYRVNVLRMGEEGEEPNPNFRNARLLWTDPQGREWRMYWGPHPQPGGFQTTNPDAPEVKITRAEDTSGLLNEWHVVTLEDLAPERLGTCTAFLWLENNPNGPDDYCGAFDVSFEFVAVEEP
ncbi:MAG: hypothetical protein ACF8R7_04695 [Phycisphaerales bacterium JB039]